MQSPSLGDWRAATPANPPRAAVTPGSSTAPPSYSYTRRRRPESLGWAPAPCCLDACVNSCGRRAATLRTRRIPGSGDAEEESAAGTHQRRTQQPRVSDQPVRPRRAARGRACTSCRNRTGTASYGPAPWNWSPPPLPAASPSHPTRCSWSRCRRPPAGRCRSTQGNRPSRCRGPLPAVPRARSPSPERPTPRQPAGWAAPRPVAVPGAEPALVPVRVPVRVPARRHCRR